MRSILRPIIALLLIGFFAVAGFSFFEVSNEKTNVLHLLAFTLFIILVTLLIMRLIMTSHIEQLTEWLKKLRTGRQSRQPEIPTGNLLNPLVAEAQELARSLVAARESASEEARLRMIGESLWTAQRLKEHLRFELGGKNLFVVSNREPYMNVKKGENVQWIVPAGGLVTALDPVLQACGGVWIAYGSGDADRETSDDKGRVEVPPDAPRYKLRRVWLTKEEESGYYYNFSNEGIWPLCHITYTRPIFRVSDWNQYLRVNEKFADVVLDEIANEKEPLILLQDFHLSILPKLIKAKRPDARIAIFWHIPWPNPEAFGICPWKDEILMGLLGADLIGFHVQFHCNNFLETVDRFLEAKINREQLSVERQGHVTFVKPFPISVAFPGLPELMIGKFRAESSNGKKILDEIGVHSAWIGLGVDRIDYTKGIIERLKAIERFLEKHPEFIEKFTFIELGAPSRTEIKRYKDLISEIEATVEQINARFRTNNWKPVIFLKANHSHEQVNRFYKIAHVCLVTSLHDGMNLVAKEYAAARDDEDGVLILSQFTGASRELLDALIVNPYDIEQLADQIHAALTMNPSERNERMKRLRATIRARNVYRWAAKLISTLARLRIEEKAKVE